MCKIKYTNSILISFHIKGVAHSLVFWLKSFHSPFYNSRSMPYHLAHFYGTMWLSYMVPNPSSTLEKQGSLWQSCSEEAAPWPQLCALGPIKLHFIEHFHSEELSNCFYAAQKLSKPVTIFPRTKTMVYALTSSQTKHFLTPLYDIDNSENKPVDAALICDMLLYGLTLVASRGIL